MKISNSKKQLAKIIHENGGWRDEAKFSAQDKDGEVYHYASRPSIGAGAEVWGHKGCIGYGEFGAKTLPNWHQTILSRDEYFHLYPAPDAKKEFCESVMRSIPEPEIHSKNTALTQVDDIDVVESKPTIEQLAADYRNAKDYADRKQQQADDAKADADAKLAALVAAGNALGLVLSVAGAEPELVITDWRDLRVGDEVEYLDGAMKRKIGMVGTVDEFDRNSCSGRFFRIRDGHNLGWPTKWRFIRRP